MTKRQTSYINNMLNINTILHHLNFEQCWENNNVVLVHEIWVRPIKPCVNQCRGYWVSFSFITNLKPPHVFDKIDYVDQLFPSHHIIKLEINDTAIYLNQATVPDVRKQESSPSITLVRHISIGQLINIVLFDGCWYKDKAFILLAIWRHRHSCDDLKLKRCVFKITSHRPLN